jgi:hypothetical protein
VVSPLVLCKFINTFASIVAQRSRANALLLQLLILNPVMETVLLYSFTSPDIRVTIEAYFNEAGGLVVDGYDIGKSVEDYFGDSDYEYVLTVPQPEVVKLYTLFLLYPNDPSALLRHLQSQFNTNHCYSDIKNFLEKNQVHYESFSWS